MIFYANSVAVSNENTATSDNDTDVFSFYILGNDNCFYTGTQNVPGGKLGNGKFISAQNVVVTKSDFSKSGEVSSTPW